MKIRKAEIRDLKRIQELNLLLFGKEHKEYDELLNLNWTFSEAGEKAFRKHLIKEDSCAFVVEDSNVIVGYLVGSVCKLEEYRNAPKSAELDNMFVLGEYRGNGAGKMLCDAFVEWCKNKNIKILSVSASAGNKQAIGFYH